MSFLVLAGLAAPSASADPTPTSRTGPAIVAPPSADDVFAELDQADADVLQTSFDLQNDTQELLQLQQAQQAAQGVRDRAAFVAAVRQDDVTKAVAVVAKRKAAVDQQVRSLRRLATESYVAGDPDDLENLRALLKGDTTDLQGRTDLMFKTVVKHATGRLRADRRAQAAAEHVVQVDRVHLADAQAQLQAAQAALDAATTATTQQQATVAEATDLHAKALRDQAAAQAKLRAESTQAPGQVPLATPLEGPPRLDADDLAGWFAQSTYHSAISTPIPQMAQWFIDEGRQENIRGDIAFAQAVLETGGFTNPDSVNANNYSGIGHCDSCAGGFAFPSPQMGVRAQIQLLKSYAEKDPTYANPLVDSRLHGPAGCCPTWGDLTQHWATAPNYGPIVMAIYTSIVQYALTRHAATLG